MAIASFSPFLPGPEPAIIRAASQDSDAAALMGVDINRMLTLCFALGVLMAGFAGFGKHDVKLNATMGMEYTIIAIIVIVLGGLGSIPGSLLAVFSWVYLAASSRPSWTSRRLTTCCDGPAAGKPSGIFGVR